MPRRDRRARRGLGGRRHARRPARRRRRRLARLRPRRARRTTTCSSTSASPSRCSSPRPQRRRSRLQEAAPDDHDPCHRHRARLRHRRRQRRRRLRELARRRALRRRDRLHDGEERSSPACSCSRSRCRCSPGRARSEAAPRGPRRGASGSGSRPSRASAAASRSSSSSRASPARTRRRRPSSTRRSSSGSRCSPSRSCASGSGLRTSPRSRSCSPARPGSPASAGTVAFGAGETMILAATLLWAVEVVLVKRLLASLAPRTLAAARMGVGSGRSRRLARVSRAGWATSLALGAEQWGWAAADRAPARRLRRHLVRGARARAGRRRDGRARLRRGHHRAARRRGRRSGRSTPVGLILVTRGRGARRASLRCGGRAGRWPRRDRRAAALRPLRLPAERARPVRRRRDRGRCSSTAAPASSDGGLAELARTFEGAWPYLELIAGANGIADPLDPRVVEAYWVGNELLDRVSPGALARHVDDRFRGRIGRSWSTSLDAVAAGAVPHHSFHVFAVYPWLGLLRTGVVDEPLRVLDRCRTTPGARRVGRRRRAARSRCGRSLWDGRRLRARRRGRTREVRWRDDGLALSPRPRPATGSRCTGTSPATG